MKYTMEMINEHVCHEGEYEGYVWLAWTDENGDEHYYPAMKNEALRMLNEEDWWYFAN